jgi:hypothetical protein
VIRDLLSGPKRLDRLTPAGTEPLPVIDALGRRGLRHAWRPPRAGEPLHAGHLLRSVTQSIDLEADDHEPARRHFRLDGADYLVESDGCQWSLSAGPAPARADVTIIATTQALTARIFAGSDTGIDIAGETGQVQRFRQAPQHPDKGAAGPQNSVFRLTRSR